MTSATTLRIDEADKKEASQILRSIGLTLNGYLNMAVKQLINQRRVPFELVPMSYEPTEETRLAMLRVEAKAAGLIPDDDPAFDNVEDFFASLEE